MTESTIAAKKQSQKKGFASQRFDSELYNYFGESLREIRTELGITQIRAAELLGVTQAQWSAYEVGKTKPTLDTVIQISMALKIDPFELINRSLDKTNLFNSQKGLVKVSKIPHVLEEDLEISV